MKKLTLILIALALVASPSFAAGSKKVEKPKMDIEAVYNEGVDLLEKGDYAAAAKKFELVVNKKESFAEAHNNLAYSLRKQGAEHYESALEHYNTAIELKPDLAQAYHYRGVLHALAGDEAKAKADHAKLVDLDAELADSLMKVIASGEEPEGMAGAAKKWQ